MIQSFFYFLKGNFKNLIVIKLLPRLELNLSIIFIFITILISAQPHNFPEIDNQQLFHKVEEAWEVSWKLFFDDNTNLFYDFISSYDSTSCLSVLPTPQEIARQIPNRNGWGTGMEDCAIRLN
jgi:hypothetical protein